MVFSLKLISRVLKKKTKTEVFGVCKYTLYSHFRLFKYKFNDTVIAENLLLIICLGLLYWFDIDVRGPPVVTTRSLGRPSDSPTKSSLTECLSLLEGRKSNPSKACKWFVSSGSN